MEHIAFAQIGDLAEYMINRVEDKEYIVAALFFDNAVELMRSLLLYDEVRIGTIEISDIEYDGYTGEYYVSLMDDYTLCVERALSDDKYLRTDAALLLLDGDVKYAIVEANDASECVEIAIGDDDCGECVDASEMIDRIFNTIKMVYDPENHTASFAFDGNALYNLLFN